MLRVVVSMLLISSIPARADTCEAEAAELRAHLETESRRAQRWNLAWALIYGGFAAGQLGFAIAGVKPTGAEIDQDSRETLYVGASKATLGVITKIALPLRIPVPSKNSEACADVKQLRGALAEASKREARSFWLTHIGGTVVNLAGATILTIRRNFRTGAISFAVSYPSGPAAAYTQPRKSWRMYRDRKASWVVGATGGPDGAHLWLGGQW